MGYWDFFNPNNSISASSGNVGNSTASATLTPSSAQRVFVSGIEITAGGATAAAVVTATLTGLIGGTLSWTFGAPAGVGVPATPLVVPFVTPLQCTALGQAVTLSLPALGAGNTNACVTLHGFIF